ncbi:MAG TPA: amidase family protein, partial [Xanthobacteraceae bacterium]|nr:amidase family protein [Xanthobacteraceae bacterium]
MTARSVRDRLEQALARIADPQGEGARACLTVYAANARLEADAADARAKAGMTLGPLDGAIVSIKDLFDVKGEPTRAGSTILVHAPPAAADASAVRRLRAAGGVIVAKTNMTEFAFSGIGLNPHYGTPGNPADRARVPGGSSSGAAVAAADRLCDIAIGTDTGGSTRIPAALCGIVGFKPSRQRIPTEGAFPLSFMLDSIGPLARSVADCARADAAMAGDEPAPLDSMPLAGLRLGIPRGLPLADFDAAVTARFAAAREKLGRAGVRLSEEPIDDFLDPMVRINAKGGFAPAEAYSIHRERLAAHAADFDPNVRFRIERGAALTAADYVAMARERAALVRAIDARLADLDGLVLP